MILKRITAIFLSLLIAAGSLFAQAANPREKLDTAIPEAIRLLEAKDYVAFLQSFMAPNDLQGPLNGGLREFAQKFGEDKAPRLLQVLKTISGTTPSLEAGGTKAVYDWREPVGGKRSITFVKVDNYWYIQN